MHDPDDWTEAEYAPSVNVICERCGDDPTTWVDGEYLCADCRMEAQDDPARFYGEDD